MNNQDIYNIPTDKFELVQSDMKIYDAVPATRPIGYFEDAMRRFVKNKASVVGAIIIFLIILFAIIAPMLTPYTVRDFDGYYARVRPKVSLFQDTGFWNGAKTVRYNERYLMYTAAIGMGATDPTGHGNPITWQEGLDSKYNAVKSISEPYMTGGQQYFDVSVDSYHSVGFRYVPMSKARFEAVMKWQEENGIQVVYPMIDTSSKYAPKLDQNDANYWYRTAANGSPVNKKGKPMSLKDVQENGLVDNYLRDANGEVQYSRPRDKTMLDVRVLYYNYYQFMHGHEPMNAFGTDAQGYDIMVRMAQGTRLSLLLAIAVSVINLTLGAVIGALEGYYGGLVDLITERIIEIISGMPFYVVATLFQLHLVSTGKVSTFVGLLFAFVLTGWIGTASRVRTQFYRFKKEEYILSARTLGASDARLMFKHIFPNAIGTIITSSILVIPYVILSESTLSFLGIVNFQGREMTSLGTMLSNAQGYLRTDPHILFFPATIISLLMICFNLFGNGLRDAFNPSLRGADE